MSAAQQPVYTAPFDAVATRYDDTFTSSLIGQAQRAAVRRELEKAFHPGERILELGCGTGADACFLARRGVRVLATDSSPAMIAVTAHKVREIGVQEFVEARLLRAEDIANLPAHSPFDGTFSNFGVLNCVGDLRKLARDLAQLLKPGASAWLCWMGPRCLWEMAWYLLERRTDKAFRRLNREGSLARIADGAFVHVRYPSVKMLARAFTPAFRLKSVKGIGVAVPPSYMEHWAQRHPSLLQACKHADSWLSQCPGIRTLGDHVLVRLQRNESGMSIR